MCIATRQTAPKIARRARTVYKIVSGKDYSSMFCDPKHKIIYQKGVVYHAEMKDTGSRASFDGQAGLRLLKLLGENYEDRLDELNWIGSGFHFATSKKRLEKTCKLQKQYGDYFKAKIVSFRIPKGAQYYLDGDGLGVCNQIKRIGI